MLDWIYLDWYIVLLPVAFLHGWFVGRSHGVRKGAADMFDHLYDKGTRVKGKQHTKIIEISLDE